MKKCKKKVEIFFFLNFLIILKIVFQNKRFYFFLEKENHLLNFLKFFKKNINVINFQINKIEKKNENLSFYSENQANKYTSIFLKKILKNKKFKDLNSELSNGELKLLFSKYVYSIFTQIILRIEVANYYVKEKKVLYYNLDDLDLKIFIEKEYGIKIFDVSFLKKLKLYLRLKFNLLKFFLISTFSKIINFTKKITIKEKLILVVAEGNVNFDENYRSEFFFIDKKIKKICIGNVIKLDQYDTKKNNVFEESVFLRIFKKEINQGIDKIFFRLINSTYMKQNYLGFFYLLKNNIISLKKLSGLFNKYNIKLSLSSVSNYTTVNIDILRKLFNHKSISYQYSFIKRSNPIMSYCSDYMFLFSKPFHEIFSNIYSKPKFFFYTGYLYDFYKKKCLLNKKTYIKKFDLKNKFVISFFDENFDEPWGATHRYDIKQKYLKLADLILRNKDVVVIIKTQFISNNPSVLFQNNNIINKAFETNRFIEFSLDNKNFLNRNIVMPMMASLISNITLSHKYGGTTSIETAIVNKKDIMINDLKMKTKFDKYLGKNVLFSNLDNALKEILKLKNKQKKAKLNRLGDWNNILYRKLKFSKKNNNFIQSIKKLIHKEFNR